MKLTPGSGMDGERVELRVIFGKVTVRILPFLCACYIASAFDRIKVGFAKLQMLDALGFSEAVYGLGAGVFFVGYILFEVPSILVLERVGARVWIARIMITWGIISMLGAFVRTPGQFYAMRFLLGVAEAGFLPGVLYYLSRWYPSYRRSRILALFLIGIPLASVIGAPLSGWIMREFTHVGTWDGWQWLFVLTGAPTVALGFIALGLLTERPRDAKWLTADERHALQTALDADTTAVGHTKHSLRDGLLNLKVWILGGIDFAAVLSLYMISFWLPTFVRSAGVADPFRIGLWTAVPNIAGLIAMLAIGASSDRLQERRWHIIVPFLVSAASAVAATRFADGNLAMTVLLFSLTNAGILGSLPTFFSIPTTFLRGTAAAAGFATVTSIANISGFVGNSLMGLALDLTGNNHAALAFAATFLVIGAVLVYGLPARLINR